ncbi:AbrB/MazE/SpoVT family DNA-binding domain-containing protein [Halorubrum sp. RMP-47]
MAFGLCLSCSARKRVLKTYTVGTASRNMTKVDANGRVALPEGVRERLGLTPGTEVHIHEEDGRAIIEPELDPELIIERMEQLIAETSSEQRQTMPFEKGNDPLAEQHRETTRSGAIESNNN